MALLEGPHSINFAHMLFLEVLKHESCHKDSSSRDPAGTAFKLIFYQKEALLILTNQGLKETTAMLMLFGLTVFV